MHIRKMISTVDCHTAGEPTRIITGGIPHIPGNTMMEKKIWMQVHLDNVRKMLMWEPRGHQDMFGAVITSPADGSADGFADGSADGFADGSADGFPDGIAKAHANVHAHAGVIFMDSKGYLDMCGHGSIAAVTVLLNTGMIPLTDKVIIDTPAGKITAHVTIEEERAVKVRICNVPAFFYDSITIELPSVGKLNVDISYGGNFFALVNVEDLNMALTINNLALLKQYALEIRKSVNDVMDIVHPGTGESADIPLTEIYQNGPPAKNVVVFGNGQIDRSPCGTGTCAKMALLFAKKKLRIGESYQHSSIIDTLFTGKIIGETEVGGKRAILPEIAGEAYVTGFHNFTVEKNDPFKEGFSLQE